MLALLFPAVRPDAGLAADDFRAVPAAVAFCLAGFCLVFADAGLADDDLAPDDLAPDGFAADEDVAAGLTRERVAGGDLLLGRVLLFVAAADVPASALAWPAFEAAFLRGAGFFVFPAAPAWGLFGPADADVVVAVFLAVVLDKVFAPTSSLSPPSGPSPPPSGSSNTRIAATVSPMPTAMISLP